MRQVINEKEGGENKKEKRDQQRLLNKHNERSWSEVGMVVVDGNLWGSSSCSVTVHRS